MKRPDGVTVIAIVHFFIGALVMLSACFVLATMPMMVMSEGSGGGRLVGTMAVGITGLMIIVFGLLPVLAGWGLLKLKEWARWLTIILAILMLFGFPVGTAIGGLIIWYLLKPEVAMAFGSGVPVVPQPVAAMTPPIPTVPPTPAPWTPSVTPPPAPNYPPQQSTPPAPNYPPQQGTPPASNER